MTSWRSAVRVSYISMPRLHSNPHLFSARSSAADLLAYTVCNLFPTAVCASRELSDIGFYYDFYFENPIDESFLDMIETEMKRFVKENLEIRVLSMMRENAHDLLLHHNQPFFAEQALEEETNIISICQIGNFYGLSSENHVQSTLEIGFVKLLGMTQHENLVRILGTAFTDKNTLKQFTKAFEKLKKIDPLKFDLKLVELIDDQYFFLPRGETIKNKLIDIWNDKNRDIQKIATPLCDLEQHIKLFKSQKYKEDALPIRWGEIGQKGDLATIFCSDSQLQHEINYSLQIFQQIVKMFDFEAYWYLIASKQKGRIRLEEALKLAGITYEEENSAKDAKIEVRWVDFLGREQKGPALELRSLGAVWVIARSLFGLPERMLQLMVEHWQGDFPFWLVPEQVRVLQVGPPKEYAKQVYDRCKQRGLRVSLDATGDKLADKVHAAEKEQVPYLLIVGEREVQQNKVAIRQLREKTTNVMALEAFLEKIEEFKEA